MEAVLAPIVADASEGEPFEQAVLDTAIMRLRPVMITVGATVFGLFPLAAPRRPAVGAALLRADRRTHRRHLRHPVAGAGVLRDLRTRFEDCEVGQGAGAAADRCPAAERGPNGWRLTDRPADICNRSGTTERLTSGIIPDVIILQNQARRHHEISLSGHAFGCAGANEEP